MGWSMLALAVAGALLWMAVKTFDSAVSLAPMVCRGGGDTDWNILLMAVLAPFFGISILGAISELWQNLERKRLGRFRRWTAFWAFNTSALVLGFIILTALNC